MNDELMTNAVSTIPERTVKAGDTVTGVQICPIGDFPNGGKNQRCTAEALNRVVETWRGEGAKDVLVDFEHRAEAGGTSDTSAAAWVTNLRVEPDRGLVGDFKMTDLGADAVSNRRLRFLSVAWYVNRETREPIRICSVALTNKPNIPTEPILNKDQPVNPNVEGKKETHTMDPAKIKEALGLPPEASDEDVLAAIAGLVKAKNDAEAARKDAEAEEFANKNAKKCNKEVLKAQFLANREVAEAIVAAIPEPKAEVVVNKADAKAPTAASFQTGAASDEAVLNKYEGLSGKEKTDFLEAHALEINRARVAREQAK